MWELGKKVVYALEENFLLMVVRHGLVMMIPFILTGGMACALYNLPLEGYQDIINGPTFGWVLDCTGRGIEYEFCYGKE